VANEAVLNVMVSWSFVWDAYLCLDLSSISKDFDGSMLMGFIFYSSYFYVLSMWEWCPCMHHGCLMSMRTCEAWYIPDRILIYCFHHQRGSLALQLVNDIHHYIEKNKVVKLWSMAQTGSPLQGWNSLSSEVSYPLCVLCSYVVFLLISTHRILKENMTYFT
jgi:hypothetical protein